MISSAGKDDKKTFGIVNTLCNKSRDNPLPDHDSELALVNEFGLHVLKTKVAKYRDPMVHLSLPICSTEMVYNYMYIASPHYLKSKFTSWCLHLKPQTASLYPPPTRLLKEHLDDIFPLLTHLNNKSLSEGTFPDVLKFAVVIPLLKTESLYCTPSNYRPVSNYIFFLNWFEGAVVHQLCDHMNSDFSPSFMPVSIQSWAFFRDCPD